MGRLTATIVGRMGDRAQGRSRTPDIPDEWEHVPAPGCPARPLSDKIKSHRHGLKIQAEYQQKWNAWHEKDVETRKAQWAEINKRGE